MAASSSDGRRPAIRAPAEAWLRLGELLQRRRQDLGHQYRTTFSRDRGINIRFVSDIEKAVEDRQNTFSVGSVQRTARAYAVTYRSLVAVLRGEADELVPDEAAAPAARGAAVLEGPLPADAVRAARAQPYSDRLWERVWVLAAQGVTDPPGREVFPGSDADAGTWDALARRWPVPARVRLMADLQAWESSAAPPGTRSGMAG